VSYLDTRCQSYIYLLANNYQISNGLKKHRDYFGVTEEAKLSPKNTLCIENFGQDERRDSQIGEASVFLEMACDCQRAKLLYLENRGNIHLQIMHCSNLFVC
jgi:hypothetical protein